VKEQGKYIVIEGHEGTGKTSQVHLLRERLAKEGIESIEMIEPGSVPIAQALREVIKDASLKRDATTNLLLFTAARHETWRQMAKPALEAGKWVVAGRNWYSTLAIQGYAEGLDSKLITEITRQFTSERYLHPDLAIILVMQNEQERQQRLEKRGLPAAADTFESKDAAFQEKVRRGYEKITDSYNVMHIDASQSLEAVAKDVWRYTQPLQ
jgi:dTMP kinase